MSCRQALRLWLPLKNQGQILPSGSTHLRRHPNQDKVSMSLAFISRTKWWAQDTGLPQKQIRCSDSSSMVPGEGARGGVGEAGKKECIHILGSICCVPGNKGVSAGAELPATKS